MIFREGSRYDGLKGKILKHLYVVPSRDTITRHYSTIVYMIQLQSDEIVKFSRQDLVGIGSVIEIRRARNEDDSKNTISVTDFVSGKPMDVEVGFRGIVTNFIPKSRLHSEVRFTVRDISGRQFDIQRKNLMIAVPKKRPSNAHQYHHDDRFVALDLRSRYTAIDNIPPLVEAIKQGCYAAILGRESFEEKQRFNDYDMIIRLLIVYGADPHQGRPFNPLGVLVSQEHVPASIRHEWAWMLMEGTGSGCIGVPYPLHAIVRQGHPELLTVFLETGYDPNEFNLENDTPLMLAVSKSGRESTVQLLLNHGADPHLKNENGQDSFRLASWNTRLVDMLMRGASLSNKDFGQLSVLYWAVFHDQLERVAKLLSKKNNGITNVPHGGGDALLNVAVRRNMDNMIWLLLSPRFKCYDTLVKLV